MNVELIIVLATHLSVGHARQQQLAIYAIAEPPTVHLIFLYYAPIDFETFSICPWL